MKTTFKYQVPALSLSLALAFCAASTASLADVAVKTEKTVKTTETTVAPVKTVPIIKGGSETAAVVPKAEDFWKGLTRNHKIAWLSGDLQVPTDTVETANQILLTAEVPGLDESCLDVIVNKDSVTLKCDKKISTLQKADDYRRIERAYGNIEKTIALPATVDADLASATISNGLLTVVLPKASGAHNEGKKLSIKRE